VVDHATPAYTVASLAAALGVSSRVVRGAIARGELAAVKRGGRWIISADAVRAWAQHDGATRPASARRTRARADRPLGSAIALLGGANAAQRSL
jgi:excisionase family DNA binding protein